MTSKLIGFALVFCVFWFIDFAWHYDARILPSRFWQTLAVSFATTLLLACLIAAAEALPGFSWMEE